MASFLGSDISGDDITDTKNFRSQFEKKLGKFDEGKLKDLDVTRIKVRRFQAIEDKVNDILEAHEKLFVRTKCGLSWLYFQKNQCSLLRQWKLMTSRNHKGA